uniref:Alginate lyase n=1 Tax=Mycena chlorophos TaxID=658473 RepID=A0ABQ0LYP6_MYCCL|nr:alginate lyase [Mycena chlorophos]
MIRPFVWSTLLSFSLFPFVCAAIPQTVVLDATRLATVKAQLQYGTETAALRSTLATLVNQANYWLSQGPWSVTNKSSSGLPPGATIYDYVSQAPYFWPGNTSTGCPYVEYDGQVYPGSQVWPDHDNRGRVFASSYILSLAWYYTGNAAYSQQAANVIRTWFITNATAMNPNLNHAQFIPCSNSGRYIGIIDFSQGYTSVLDAVAILQSGAPGWTAADAAGFVAWNTAYSSWLETSSFGQQETAATNNHGTFALMQSAGVALFLGNTALARSKVNAMLPRISAYITANGSQPQELARTRSFHYSVYDLLAYTRMADIASKVGVNVWGYTGSNGQSIQQAVNFIIPAASGAQSWSYPELDFEAYTAGDVIHAAADAGNPNAVAALKNVPTPPSGSLWFIRPAPELLDQTT